MAADTASIGAEERTWHSPSDRTRVRRDPLSKMKRR
jgi:hypothetical protein